ncbi:MAG: methionyl-tRNA formyltransferase [Planctomycetia bacterium]|nr:methionyl-tRNA formyltransferase [Planctomycetia bacterium]
MTASQPLRIVLAGATSSTRLTLESLVRHQAPLVGVMEFQPDDPSAISSFARLNDVAAAADIPCVSFQNINALESIAQVRAWQPDLCFVVGLSQLVKSELLAIPRMASVGFHPTWLPRGRGRAPVAWLVHDAIPGAVTYFVMDEGADSGPILVQEPFAVSPRDDASDVTRSMEKAIGRALDRWLPKLLAGEWNPQPQDDSQATYHAKRGPEDGWIDWSASASDIHRLIRVAARPHPGAYTYLKDRKLIVWHSEIETSYPIRGVIGRVLLTDPPRGALVQTGDGLLWLRDVTWSDNADPTKPLRLSVGQRLGYVVEDEVSRLKHRVTELERIILDLVNNKNHGEIAPK